MENIGLYTNSINNHKQTYMKKRNTILPAIIILLLLAAWLLPTEALCQKEDPANNEETTITTDGKRFSQVTAPTVPEKMRFAGKDIDLTTQDRRERMDKEMLSLCYSHINSTLQFKRANRLFPIIEPILKECGVPDDLKYLMIVESTGDIEARSPAGACGLWQFMEGTGKEYGLEISKEVDERFSIEKATRAACKYLKDSYSAYGDWLTVAASYNTGRGNVNKRIKAQKQNEAINLLLLNETSRYIFRILAVKNMFENPKRYGFNMRSSDLYPQIPTKTVTVDTDVASWPDFAKKHGLSYLQLHEANPWIRDVTLTNKTNKKYKVLIPDAKALKYNPAKTKAHNPNWVTE